MRHTLETVTDTVEKLRAQDPVFKVDVDELKDALSRAFDADEDTLRAKYIHAGRYKALNGDEHLVYEAMPLEMRHFYSKKFSKILRDAPLSEFTDAVRSLRNRWRPLYMAQLELIARQTKGRKPRPPMEDVLLRDQLRAECACCFRDIAVDNAGIIHDHGFDIAHGFRNGTCRGANAPHFGTKEGHDFAHVFKDDLLQWATEQETLAAAYRDGTKVPVLKDRDGRKIDAPPPRLVEHAARDCDYRARQMRVNANFIDDRLKTWGVRDPAIHKVRAT